MPSEQVRARPTARLRGGIAWYDGYRECGVAPATHHGLPSPWLTVIITLDDPLTVAQHPDPRQVPSVHTTLIGGLHTAPALVTHEGRQSGVQLAVSPLAARSLFGAPAGELAELDLEGEQVLGSRAAELHERMRGAATWRGRFAALEHVLQPAPVRPPAAEIVRAWRRLLVTGGRVRVQALADEVGWSARHLTAQFRAEVGLPPSAAARVIRFDRTRRALQDTRARVELSVLATTYGYYDQAHLTREFTALAGLPPARWLRDQVRSVQDDDAVPPRPSRA